MPITKASGQAVAPAAKGDLVVGSATNDAAVLNVGSANQVLTVDSSTTTGLKWASAGSSFVGASVYETSSQLISNATTTTLAFGSEYFDTDNFHNNSTNTGRLTIPSGKDGKYLITAFYTWNANGSGRRNLRLFKNGSLLNDLYFNNNTSNYEVVCDITTVVNAVAGDYFEVRAFQNSGSDILVVGTGGYTGSNEFSIVYLGA